MINCERNFWCKAMSKMLFFIKIKAHRRKLRGRYVFWQKCIRFSFSPLFTQNRWISIPLTVLFYQRQFLFSANKKEQEIQKTIGQLWTGRIICFAHAGIRQQRYC